MSDRPALRAEVYPVDAVLARLMLDTMSFERQRNIMPKHVRYLADTIRRGELTSLVLSLGEYPDNRTVLIDGYHRLTALLEVGATLPAALIFYAVEKDEDLNKQYIKLDRVIVRRPQDMLRAYGTEQKTGLTNKNLRILAPAVNIVDAAFQRTVLVQSKSMIRVVESVESWAGEGAAYFECLEGSATATRLLLTRASVVAVGLATLRHQPAMARDFWSSVAAEDALPKDSPQAVLLKYLRANIVHRPVQYARYVAAAWNAYFEGRKVTLLKVVNPDGPFVLRGTPFN